MTVTDHVIKKVFVNIEQFLQKVAALDVFETLIFNYKTKVDLPDSLAVSFLSIISEFSDGVNLLLKEDHNQCNNADLPVPDSKPSICSDSVVKPEESCQDIPLVLSFCNDGVSNSIELVEITVQNNVDQLECPGSCDDSDAEKIDSTNIQTQKSELPEVLNACVDETLVKLVDKVKKEKKSPKVRRKKNENLGKSNIGNGSFSKKKFPSAAKQAGHVAKCPKVKTKNKNQRLKNKCDVCGMTFATRKLLNSHKSQNHVKEENGLKGEDDPTLYHVVEVQTPPENLPFYCCKNCLFVYKTPGEFEAHPCKEILFGKVESEGYIGDYFHLLGKYLVSNPDLLARMHKFRCGICCEEYRSLHRMLYHLLRCTQGPYSCELCGLECSSKSEINRHKRTDHRDANSFFCDECGLTFKLRASLQKHKVNRHERKALPVCEQCNVTFSKRIQLTNHMLREHQVERKFLCQVCGKKFCTHGSLTAHLSSHSETFKFTCTYCNKKFRQKEKLKFHTRIHTGERPHLCPTCGKGFIRKSKLDDHMKRHRGEKQYHCSVCNKCYASSWDLKLHISKKHPDENGREKTLSEKKVEIIKSVAAKTEPDESAEFAAPITPTTNALSRGETAEHVQPQECTPLHDLPAESAMTQLAELPLAATEPPVETLTSNDSKLLLQLEPAQVASTVLQPPGDAVGTRLLLQLGQNGDTTSRFVFQLDGGQVGAAAGQTALLPPILTVTETLQLTPVVDELNLNLNTLPTQYLQLATAAGTSEGNDSATTASTATTAGMPVHIQLPVSAVPVPATAISQSSTSGATPYGLQSVPVQAVFTPAGFNVNGISY